MDVTVSMESVQNIWTRSKSRQLCIPRHSYWFGVWDLYENSWRDRGKPRNPSGETTDAVSRCSRVGDTAMWVCRLFWTSKLETDYRWVSPAIRQILDGFSSFWNFILTKAKANNDGDGVTEATAGNWTRSSHRTTHSQQQMLSSWKHHDRLFLKDPCSAVCISTKERYTGMKGL